MFKWNKLCSHHFLFTLKYKNKNIRLLFCYYLNYNYNKFKNLYFFKTKKPPVIWKIGTAKWSGTINRVEDFIRVEFDIGRILLSTRGCASIFVQKYLIYVDKGFVFHDHSGPVTSALCERCSHLFNCSIFSCFGAHLQQRRERQYINLCL